MASPHQYSYSHPPPPAPQQRLPSIKELHFDKMEHGHSSRHQWTRPSPPEPAPPSQHSANTSQPHESPKTQYPQTPSPPKAGESYATPSLPASQQAGTANGSASGASRADVPPTSKRPRPGSDASVSVSPGRSHAAYAQHTPYASQPPPPGFHPGAPLPIPPTHVHQPPHFTHPPPGYAPYPPPHLAQHHYAAPPPGPPMPQQRVPHPYAAPVHPHEHWQHPPHPPAQVPHQYAAFPRPPVVAPANVEQRSAMPPPAEVEKSNARQTLSQVGTICEHCRALQQFAQHYAQLQVAQPNAQPTPPELQEMTWRANLVLRLLEELRRINSPDDTGSREGGAVSTSASSATEEHTRPPKRPWEDVSRDESSTAAAAAHTSYPDSHSQYIDTTDRSTAEADMEIIRSKRATSTGGNAPGQPKTKYRKRSRATPPGKCHSCNIRETPEWRRGPDGARTLCNACGLHYAKLMRKREKGADGKAPPIDLQTLRASTQSARGSDSEQAHQQPHQQHQQQAIHHHQPPPQPIVHVAYDQQKQQPPPIHPNHHPGHPSPHPHAHPTSYQLMPVNAGPAQSAQGQAHQMMPPPLPPQTNHSETGVNVPPPPWMTSSSSARSGYASEHQSYMRASHPPSHARASPQ